MIIKFKLKEKSNCQKVFRSFFSLRKEYVLLEWNTAHKLLLKHELKTRKQNCLIRIKDKLFQTIHNYVKMWNNEDTEHSTLNCQTEPYKPFLVTITQH